MSYPANPARAIGRKPKRIAGMNGEAPLTAARKATFLRVLAETGSYRAATTAASPHLHGSAKRTTRIAPGFATFQDEMRRDPAFARAVEAAMNAAIAKAEEAIVNRMHTPTRRPVVAQGQVVGMTEEWRDANALLLRFLERHSPEWTPRKHVDGLVQHEHATAGPGGMGYLVRPQDVGMLSPPEQRTLVELLVKVDDLRKEIEDGQVETGPAALPAGNQEAGGPAVEPRAA